MLLLFVGVVRCVLFAVRCLLRVVLSLLVCAVRWLLSVAC